MTRFIIDGKQNFELNFFWAIFFYFGSGTVYEPFFRKDLRSKPWDLAVNDLKGYPLLMFLMFEDFLNDKQYMVSTYDVHLRYPQANSLT